MDNRAEQMRSELAKTLSEINDKSIEMIVRNLLFKKLTEEEYLTDVPKIICRWQPEKKVKINTILTRSK